MNNLQNFPTTASQLVRKRLLLLVQFFLIVFTYHTLKDMKDSIVITASDAGAQVIPFIKIWGMLPASIGASLFFAKLYNRYGRERTTTILTTLLLSFYFIFAFVLYPLRDHLYLQSLYDYLSLLLPSGCKGFIAMISFWHYTLFYIAAELWSPMILSVLFWGYVNEVATIDEAKKFYPLCMFTGNFAGILSGTGSHWLCHNLSCHFSWQQTMQLMISIIIICGFAIIWINRTLSKDISETKAFIKNKGTATSFRDNISKILNSPTLLCIATLVIAFGLTSNLIEVVWKENLRHLYPEPKAYNAYINQLTSLIGMLAVIMALISRPLFKFLKWSKVALITPVALFTTSSIFFITLILPEESRANIASVFSMQPLFLIAILGSIHYVMAMTAKYTLFDSCKEMAFLAVDTEERIKAKSVIDSIGARLGKSGASCLYQFLLIFFGTASGHIPIIGLTSVLFIGLSLFATKHLGEKIGRKTSMAQEAHEAPTL